MSVYKMLPAQCFESFPTYWGYKDQIKVTTKSRVFTFCQPTQLQNSKSESPNIRRLVLRLKLEKLGLKSDVELGEFCRSRSTTWVIGRHNIHELEANSDHNCRERHYCLIVFFPKRFCLDPTLCPGR